MSLYRFARGAGIAAAGFITGYFASSGIKNSKFTIHAVFPQEILQPNSVQSINNEKEPLTVMEYSLSGDTSQELIFSKFLAGYDRSRKTPNYVLELLSMNNIAGQDNKLPKREFKEDMTIHSVFRSTKEDYKDLRNKTGKVKSTKGHLACEGNYPIDEKARKETSIFSIIAPQNHKCNLGVWKALEDHVRKLLLNYKYVTVCSGPLYVPRQVDFDKMKEEDKIKFGKFLYADEYDMVKDDLSGKHEFMIHPMRGNVAVPTHFFKVLTCENENSNPVVEGYEIKNAPASYKSFKMKNFKVPIEKIERLSGYLFTNGYIKERGEEMKEKLQNSTPLEPLATEMEDVGSSREI